MAANRPLTPALVSPPAADAKRRLTEVLEPGHAVTVMSISGATAVVLGEPS